MYNADMAFKFRANEILTPPCCSSSNGSSFACHSRGRALNCRHTVNKLSAKQHVGIVEHALLERDDDKLRVLKVRLEPEIRD